MWTLLLLITLFQPARAADFTSEPPVLIENEEFRRAASSAIDSLYNRNHSSAREQMAPWENRWPDHPIWHLWDGMELWWLVLTDLYDESRDDELLALMEQADAAAAELSTAHPGHPDASIIRAVANGYIARHHANRNRWIRGVRTAQTARRAHEELGRLAPELTDNLFAEGLKKYYSAYLPEAYAILRPFRWLLPDGDKQEGLRLLEMTSRDAVFSRAEAIYFLGVILLNYEERYEEAVARFRSLVESYPNNSFYRRLLVRALYQQGQYVQAGQQIDDALAYWLENQLYDEQVLREELLYWKGRLLLQNGNNRQAHEELVRSWEAGRDLPNQNKRSFHALSAYYAAVSAERSGDREQAQIYYLYVTDMECEPDIRKRAEGRLADF